MSLHPGHMARRPSTYLVFALPLAALLLTRWWTHSDWLLDADAVNYARALAVFDLSRGSPHPPGYVLFVLLARFVHQWISDPNSAYIIVNGLMQALTLALVASVFRRMIGHIDTILIAAVVLFHPLFWYYGSTASVYTADAAVTLLIAHAILSHRDSPTAGRAFLLGLVWAGAGGIRQFTALLAAPAVLRHLWRVRRDVAWTRLISGAVLGVTLWFVPLMYLCEGWSKYKTASRDMFEYYLLTRSPLFSHNLSGVFYNMLSWCGAAFQLLWPLLPPLALAFVAVVRRRQRRARGAPADSDAGLWLLLIGPAALFFLLVHCGQMGYMLGFLVPVLAYLTGVVRGRGVSRGWRWALAATAVIEFGWFALCPPPSQKYPSAQPPEFYFQLRNWPTVAAKVYKYQSDFTRQGLQKWQDILRGYLHTISAFPADSTVIIHAYERELQVNVLGYYTAPSALVNRHWQRWCWTCSAGRCEDLSISIRDSLTVLELPPRIRTVLLIDERDSTSVRLYDPVLDRWRKGPIAVARDGVVAVEDLRVQWQ
ncbi:MAG: DUF2723 domain-containing protein [Candidatus Zixiibacteriota bacterium]